MAVNMNAQDAKLTMAVMSNALRNHKKSEDTRVANFRGEEDLDNILEFIEGTKMDKSSEKKKAKAENKETKMKNSVKIHHPYLQL